jgi:uncharacterized membrane protein YeaQ/YmgE (transglycosylase-associated protein family)
MNIVIWMLAGAVLGWLAFSMLGWNGALGKMVSTAIGAMGGILGGKMLAPLFTTAVVGEFSAGILVIAVVTAIAVLAISNLLQNRFGS